MTLRAFLVSILCATLFACANAPTQNAVAGDDSNRTGAEAEAPKMRCVREKVTGFRLKGKRICTTVSD